MNVKLRMFVPGLILFLFVVGMILWWNDSYVNSTQTTSHLNTKSNHIPEDAIRLRILAHSDTDKDQRVKRLVRDRIVAQMNGWLQAGKQTYSREEARQFIVKHQKELYQTTIAVLQAEQLPYQATLQLSEVAFPAKWYGGQVYPAGMYEALLVTLGRGEGQNWWCVLFPPLCLVDGSIAQAEKNSTASPVSSSIRKSSLAGEHRTAVRFFLWDLFVSWFT